ncbi:DUF4244 domain-containing protein [Saccharothrix lopnurensis]|uniref:DUF4244 domain-containing protein n=1 Tax=Saccharothrix lopnurensis TaxID=1670621 RepID=A0ABW1NXL4_9PSEU
MMNVHFGGKGKKLLDDRGTSTVEYSLCLLAAAALATILIVVVNGDWVAREVQEMLERAFTVTA